MNNKKFAEIVECIENVNYMFRGCTMTEEQFKQIDDLWKDVSSCYHCCLQPTPKTNSELNKKTALEILAEMNATPEDVKYMSEKFGAGLSSNPHDHSMTPFEPSSHTHGKEFYFDVCDQTKEESGGFISDVDFALLMVQTDNVIINTHNEDDAKYDDAMKVVK